MNKPTYKKDGQDRLLPKLSLFIFNRSKTAAIIWLLVTVFGIASYTTFMKREGFPSVNIPFTVAGGTYFVNDAAKVDKEIAQPIGEIILKDSRVKSVQSQARDMSYSLVVQYKSDKVDPTAIGKELDQRIKDANILPADATMKIESPKFGFTERGDDGVISVYTTDANTPPQQMVDEAQKVVEFIQSKHFADIESISVIDLFQRGTDPATGQPTTSQNKFDRYATRAQDDNTFYNAASIGFMQKDGTDVIKLNDKLQAAVNEYNQQHNGSGFKTVVSATYANDIKDQIGELQRSLFEGLIAVLIIGSLIIAVRASVVTVLSMITVLAIATGILFLIGYTLNTITLFALILCLGLVVDDTIIMIEAIDAQRRRRTDPRKAVHEATRKVSRAMIAATSTAALSFAPIIFVGGVLGSFIRAIPITVIIALVTSLVVALVFIPFFARYILLGKNQMGPKNVHEPAAGIEAKIAQFIGRPMLWARDSRKKLFFVGITAVLIGFSFIGASGYLFQKVTFNIFPPSKDSNGLIVNLAFEPSTTTAQAEQIVDEADKIIAKELGDNFKQASYYGGGTPQTAMLSINITPYTARDVTAPQLVDQLKTKLQDLKGAQVKVSPMDVGPPAAAFTVRLQTSELEKANKLAKDLKQYLLGTELKRLDGSTAKVTSASISNSSVIVRADGKTYVDVTASFDGDDTTALVGLAKTAVEKEFTASKIESYGLSKDALKFELGQEQENQDSFKALAIAFPLLLIVIYLLLCLQFRSLIQPLLIFMAIPFSLFGITLGLYLTHNAFSFFAMLGFFALIGLSLKNTILLTDYANQLRHQGVSAVDAAVEALHERFRPLIATSLTAIVSLLPLALTSPFWEGLTTVLICGLLSSTFLVIVVFPYYYLGAEFLRMHISRKACLSWLALTIAITVLLTKLGASIALLPLVALAVMTTMIVLKKTRARA